ncbi:hypothetical protein [Microbacterium gallinarum]|uniref:DUF3558 domain-containing protein n=1 Tax=Microbacterium gallinarum TaxID=2762209 RepID=A0ABR8WYP6_9MICO|nr:hypothetical protein [Microbacterium gallinarum]MBD8022048.1 hypothetical protein [Microbacterium gallinarum]
MSQDRRRDASRTLVGAVALIAIAASLAACRPEPEPSATPTRSTTPTTTATATPTVTPTPTPTAAAFVVPATCEEIYSAGMLATLEDENPPLNDPGVTMLSTQDVDLLEVIDSGLPTLRCSWGQPSEFGLATNVTAVDADQTAFVDEQLRSGGFDCTTLGDGTICSMEQKGVTLDDEEYSSGETHYIGGGGWVSTAWINFNPDGYTEDIVDTLWG